MTTLTSQCQNPKAPDLCRLCLEKSSSLISLFDYEPLENPLHCPLLSKISLCLSVRITHEDKITTKVCQSCAVKVDEFYNFYNKATQSQKLLAQWEFELEVQRTSESTVKNDFNSVLDGSSEILDGALSLQEEEEGKENNFRKHHDLLKVVDGDSLSATFDDVDATTSGTGLDTDYLNIDQLGLLSQDGSLSSADWLDDTIGCDDILSQEILALEEEEVVKKKCGRKSSGPDYISHLYDRKLSKYKCDKCHYSTAAKGNFKKHIMRHTKAYKIVCKECERGFYTMGAYKQHAPDGDCTQNLTLHCPKCSRKYHLPSKLKDHMRIHDPDFSASGFQCDACGKTFLTKRGMEKHIQATHMGIRHRCQLCGKQVTCAQSLKNHMKLHTGEKSYVCSACGKSFSCMTGLVVHERTHTGAKPYKCDLCKKSFTQPSTLKVHKRYHTGERPYTCAFCDRKFYTNTHLSSHLRTHLNDPILNNLNF
ncbi:zinc finger protein 699-like isoform X2 [Cimex lectularius]|uniref:Zinc finger protein n=1 Tax=Cimex lectularius TaxID=79782 RepID=A0A8I6TLA7_CIMLE|nr:zinc finger protein 699-like isoform X2 [Cimex lectularius]